MKIIRNVAIVIWAMVLLFFLADLLITVFDRSLDLASHSRNLVADAVIVFLCVVVGLAYLIERKR